MALPGSRFLLLLLLTTSLCAFVSCGQKTDTTAKATPAGTEAAPTDGVSFTSGFYKAEKLSETASLRWAHQKATLTIDSPEAGKHRVIVKAVTAFSPQPVELQVTVNGQSIGPITVTGSDVNNPVARSFDAELRAGPNEIVLQANRPEVSFGANDSRTASFGLILPVRSEPLP